MPVDTTGKTVSRRKLIGDIVRGSCVLATGGALGALASRGHADDKVWQIDIAKCTQCGRCATECVLNPSAVKCIHRYVVCGYCELCFGYFTDQRAGDTTAAENLRCPTDAIKRSLVEPPYYQYDVDESLCIGCGLCVKGCKTFGNGSLVLQVRHDRCLNCNECSIARVCPSQAFLRVPRDKPYLLKMPQ